jgi:polysaccharide biosynthesis/export protein
MFQPSRILLSMKVHFSVKSFLAAGAILALAGCAVMPSSGPTAGGIKSAPGRHPVQGGSIRIVDVTAAVAQRLLAATPMPEFSRQFGQGHPASSIIGNGDILEVTVWEAPPAALFGTADPALRTIGASARGTTLPEQMVDRDGRITVPFAGSVAAAGHSPQQVAREIAARLNGKAHEPQVVVRLARNATATVTVVGDVASSTRVPLTSRGERVLDVLASAGGVRQPVNKTTIRITRGPQTVAMPLEAIIRDPGQNVMLEPDDVMTVQFQPYSFVALGATNRNEEVPMEATGISLAQALGRVAGLQDMRADVKGVFLFRMEDAQSVIPGGLTAGPNVPAKIPVIYRINMKDPATFFVAQNFLIRDKDVLYVSNAPLADFQKFVNVISSAVLPVVTTISVTK